MSTTDDRLLIAKGEHEIGLLPKMANRHGLIAGATGTGKTVTLRVLAEAFSRIGVPVFMADVKGDLSGLIKPGGDKPKVVERVETLKLQDFQFRAYPVVFWDVDGVQGHPVRTTISEMGPLLLGRLLNLNDTQSGVLTLVFKIADDNGLLLLDLKDLRAMLRYVGDYAEQFRTQYGNVSAASIGTIQRNLLALEHEGGDALFGEPALNFKDFLQTSAKGEGIINILTADKLINSPKVYATLLLWLLSELFEQLPEVGDPPKPTCGLLFRRGPFVVRRCPQDPDGQDRAGGAAHPLQRGGGLFCHPKPPGPAGYGPGSVGQPGAACLAGLYPERPEGRESGRRYLPDQPQAQCGGGHHGVDGGRGPGFGPG